MTPESTKPLQKLDLTPVHAEAGFKLSALIGWNQTVDDWRYILTHGEGVGLTAPDKTLVATAMALPYDRFAWICMVLVAPDYRRQGIATRLMAEVVQRQEDAGRVPGLDATPDGRKVYSRIGFRDHYRLRRYRAESASSPTVQEADRVTVRRLAADDLEAVSGVDCGLFGADRLELLRHLLRRQPEAAFAAFHDGRLAGYALARDGREAVQVGPLVATGDNAASSLAAAAFGAVQGPVYIDVADARPEFVEWLGACGFVEQRPYIRMMRNRDSGFDDPSLLYAIAGPELG